jgi:hypothetical protein
MDDLKEQIQNPYQVLYHNPHLHAQKFAKMVAKYHHQKDVEMLNTIGNLTNRLLCSGSEMNWRQRDKYKDWGFQVGRKKFYLLPKKK